MLTFQFCRPAVSLPAGIHGGARLSILDVAGRTVAIVAQPRDQELVWDGRRTDGSFAGPGIYLWRLEAGNDRREGKVVVVR